jgi:hypothetical protein
MFHLREALLRQVLVNKQIVMICIKGHLINSNETR